MRLSENAVALLGGTFDPVHIGHLRTAIEIRDALVFKQVRLIPSAVPPHRGQPVASAAHRLAMLKCATSGLPGVEVDERELMREGTSYTVDTLRGIRTECDGPLALVVGEDQFEILDSWYQWQQIVELAHIVVVARPLPKARGLSTQLANFAGPRWVEDPGCLHSKPGGLFLRLSLTRLDVSATQVRQLLKEGRSIEYLVPKEVISYIQQNGLYGVTET